MAESKEAPGKKEENGKKVRRPSALKRDLQSQKRNLRNRAFKSKVSTAMRSLEQAVTAQDATSVKAKLSAVFSLMDKGVKIGVVKQNRAARVKSRLQKRARTSG